MFAFPADGPILIYITLQNEIRRRDCMKLNFDGRAPIIQWQDFFSQEPFFSNSQVSGSWKAERKVDFEGKQVKIVAKEKQHFLACIELGMMKLIGCVSIDRPLKARPNINGRGTEMF